MTKVHPEDRAGWNGSKTETVFARIRQKDIKNDDGEVVKKAGGYKFTDMRPDPEKIEGIVVATGPGKVWWEEIGDLKPTCKSFDGKTSINGDDCSKCEKSLWKPDRSPPDCKDTIHILVIEGIPKSTEDIRENSFILCVYGSSIKPWNKYFTSLVKRDVYPVHVLTKFTTQYIKDTKGEYYILVPETIKETPEKTLDLIRNIRKQLMEDTRIEVPYEKQQAIEQEEPPAVEPPPEEAPPPEEPPEHEPPPETPKTPKKKRGRPPKKKKEEAPKEPPPQEEEKELSEKEMKDALMELVNETEDFDLKIKLVKAIDEDFAVAYKKYVIDKK